jgi:hypothetical protein
VFILKIVVHLTAPIFLFPYWENEFYVHLDASAIALGELLTHPGEGNIYHPIAFASKKLPDS